MQYLLSTFYKAEKNNHKFKPYFLDHSALVSSINFLHMHHRQYTVLGDKLPTRLEDQETGREEMMVLANTSQLQKFKQHK